MRTWSPASISERNIETYPFTGEWERIFGNPDIRFSTLIRGEAKSGKSTFCAKMAQYVSQFGRVLYVTAEERINSKTLQDRISRCGVTSENVRFAHVRDLNEIEKIIQNGGFRFVFVDSVQHVKMNVDQWTNLKIKFRRRKLSWHLVMQMGENITKYKHEVDVLVNVSAGVASISGRYNQATAVRVFDDNQPSLFNQSTI
ncbi:bifunctional adenosylcobinamide kinase/adenosylcobinamide-phosphate guanylyltransferase [Massilibacteroides sp.]|uniref:bifunctional adenosylcobinamide kinase/adenosylcobinamide-phosphate guanylyltransferase n=1 Tax=Massilibacteroides sp. TaxID=2034766 RepID=UPI00260B57CB|nr:bifunctional adenosylcobinamide kinase/adenosylcobinamide-phosphate guanylyltransferase [Massilibacteroides sp.]MDD4516858.1 bifunctional adenosylcobinamide kinase/adenosylcobinamide-phosphate guanylyltransferase [Massilibacteroides sp.]